MKKLIAIALIVLLTVSAAYAYNGGWAKTREETIINAPITFADSDATPNVAGATFFKTCTNNTTITNFDGGEAGQIIIITGNSDSTGATTFDVTSTYLKGGSTDIVSATDDTLMFIYDGTNWLLLNFSDMSDDLS